MLNFCGSTYKVSNQLLLKVDIYQVTDDCDQRTELRDLPAGNSFSRPEKIINNWLRDD
jgi:hypothetical protein